MVRLETFTQECMRLGLVFDLIVEAFRAVLLAALLFGALVLLSESGCGVRFLEELLCLWKGVSGLLIGVLMVMLVAIRIITVAVATATLRLRHENGLVHVSIHASALDWVLMAVLVVLGVRVTRFEALWREKGMMNLLIAGLHAVVGIHHRRISHLAIVEVRRASHPMIVMSHSERASTHFLG